MLIYAHRGASSTQPENTLDAFAEAIRLGADGIELDVQGTADGVPVILHDQSLSRTTGRDLDVNVVSFATLRELAPSVPTLTEVLRLVGDRAHLDIEIKANGIAEQTIAALADVHEVRWAISCFDWTVIQACRALCSSADLWLLSIAWTPTLLATAAETGTRVVALYDRIVDEQLVNETHERGLDLMVWTVNDPDRAAQLRDWGVDALCTDNPAAMLHLAHTT